MADIQSYWREVGRLEAQLSPGPVEIENIARGAAAPGAITKVDPRTAAMAVVDGTHRLVIKTPKKPEKAASVE